MQLRRSWFKFDIKISFDFETNLVILQILSQIPYFFDDISMMRKNLIE